MVAIAGGIYSYSKRTQPSLDEIAKVDEKSADKQENVEVKSDNKTAQVDESKKAPAKAQVVSTATSQETEGSLIESAGRGDGTTHLARRALANYLEKNPDSSLTAEHKIYIEDYLRKHVGFKGRVHVGTSIEFSKDLVRQAIERSKTLNERQLKNLHKYAVLVPSLS
ncbi:hypothetical protein EPO05_00235 [Patescibacteria group bacterium]|nr:MAG: hypothetical protein EPO05_00235 [Patescibacteria group bacterium]